MYKLTASLLLLLTFVHANIVDFSDFRLAPLVLVKKHDFTYSGGLVDEENAAVRFDLSLHPMNTKAEDSYGLMIITANQESSEKMIGLLKNGTTQTLP